VKHLSTTVAVYDTLDAASADWAEVEKHAESGVLDLADAALVSRTEEGVTPAQRHSRHGWGKGAVAGAVVGVAVASAPHPALRKSFHFIPLSVPACWAALYLALHSFIVSA
jgi:hypothetical protein